jgi:hypothetical protein
MPATTVRSTVPTVERATLDNGLRVVLAPDRSSPVVAVAVYYDVGIRSEPEGRTGFAHLFEHLMFQGSASLDKMEHVKYVQASGGTLNGSTRLDYTNYYEALPSHALDRALFLEADRMRSPRVTEENLANQIAVVSADDSTTKGRYAARPAGSGVRQARARAGAGACGSTCSPRLSDVGAGSSKSGRGGTGRAGTSPKCRSTRAMASVVSRSPPTTSTALPGA